MKTIIIENRVFFFQTASDIIRDGVGVELWENDNGKEINLGEIFRNDKKKRIEFTLDVQDIPLQAVEKLIEIFKTEIPQEYQE
jgi:hypothetical protein